MWLLGLGNNQPRQRFKRKDERFDTELLQTPLGRVKNLSVSGVCIHGEGKTSLVNGAVQWIKLQAPHSSLTLQARVAWVRKQRRGFEAGLEWLDVKPSTAAALRQLAQFGFLPSGYSPDGSAPPADGGDPASWEARRRRRAKAIADASAAAPPDPYVVLGLAPDATDQQIRAAYRRLVRQYHPDANKAPDAAERLERVVVAYRTLNAKRAQNGKIGKPRSE